LRLIRPAKKSLGGLVAFMTHFQELTVFYQCSILGVIVLTGMICGGILENRRWVLVAEYVRLAIVIVLLNALYYEFLPGLLFIYGDMLSDQMCDFQSLVYAGMAFSAAAIGIAGLMRDKY
jgi:hypothetical protein